MTTRFLQTLLLTSSLLTLFAGTTRAIAQIQPPPESSQPVASTIALAKSRIDTVTVYRGQALVTRVVELKGESGLQEVIVGDLPTAILPGSLYADGGGGVEVRSVSYRVRPTAVDTRENVRQLEVQIREQQDKIALLQGRKQFMEWQRQYLDKLENYLSGTAIVENNKGVMNADTIAKMTTLVCDLRRKQVDDGNALTVETRTAQEQLDLLQRQMRTLTAKSSRSSREAVIFVSAPATGGTLRLNYLVDNASWAPSYNLRRSVDGKTCVVEYQASVRQQSGEDWGSVQMTLSTATPALLASGPTLKPMMLAIGPVDGRNKQLLDEYKDKSYDDAKRDLAAKQVREELARNSNIAPASMMLQSQSAAGSAADAEARKRADVQSGGIDRGLNRVANDSALLDLIINEQLSKAKTPRKPQSPLASGDEGVSVNYRVATRTSLPSRDDQQLIQILSASMPMSPTKVATPALTANVYDEAALTNAGEAVLLAGPAASYMVDQFVGRSELPTVSAGENFTVGFGIDPSLRTSRELVERAETIQGGNRIIELTYRLNIENFGKNPVPIRLVDRMPVPKGQEIRVVLNAEHEKQLSTDEQYLKQERKLGILRWDVTVPASATGAKAWTIDYKFRVEFDKQMSISEVER